METPPSEPAVRRTTRSALAEIPSRMGALTVNENTRDTIFTRGNTNNLNTVSPLGQTNIPLSFLTPSPSPDELVIQQRGRRRIPVTWSPDIDLQKREGLNCKGDRTPVKHNPASPSKSTIVLRSTPRKRLLLNEPLDIGSPEKRKLVGSPNFKKIRLEVTPPVFDGPIDLALKALSSEQLVGLIQKFIIKFPDCEQDVKALLPVPDLRPLEDRLNYLKKNIFKSLPSSRLTGRTDSPAYSRAATHLLAFKKCLIEQGRTLVDSEQWGSVVDYVLMAWNYIRATPVWDNAPHNTPRRSCFKALAAQCMTALRRGKFSGEFLDELQKKLQGFLIDCDDIQACLQELQSLKQRH